MQILTIVLAPVIAVTMATYGGQLKVVTGGDQTQAVTIDRYLQPSQRHSEDEIDPTQALQGTDSVQVTLHGIFLQGNTQVVQGN